MRTDFGFLLHRLLDDCGAKTDCAAAGGASSAAPTPPPTVTRTSAGSSAESPASTISSVDKIRAATAQRIQEAVISGATAVLEECPSGDHLRAASEAAATLREVHKAIAEAREAGALPA